MDNASDRSIFFDGDGYCNYCSDALRVAPRVYLAKDAGDEHLSRLLTRLKESNGQSEYDCAIGLSGGLDSSFLAFKATHEWGLRVLALHVDDGFDTTVATSNIRKLVDACGIVPVNLHPRGDQYRDLLRAHMIAGVPNIAAPQDNVLFAALRKELRARGVPVFLSGGNFALEAILQRGNSHDAMDGTNIRDIGERFGEMDHGALPLLTQFTRRVDLFLNRLEMPRPLNFIDYTLEGAIEDLREFCGFEYYGGKHHENHFTRFLQTQWMPRKFGVDKRTSHLSSLIVTNQLTREEAIYQLSEPPVSPETMEADRRIVADLLGLTPNQVEGMLASPGVQHSSYAVSRYPSFEALMLKPGRPLVRSLRGLRRTVRRRT